MTTFSPVQICNQALAEIGARATITSLDEESKEAVNCKIFYDSTRLQLLRLAHWGFARKQIALTEMGNLTAGTSEYPWQYKYAYPADMVRLRYLLCPAPAVDATLIPPQGVLGYNPRLMPSRMNRFVLGNDGTQRIISSNVPNAIAVYTADITNVDFWDQYFSNAMNAALAARLCLAITGNIGMKAQFEAEAQDAVLQARVADANEALPSTDHTPDWIKARGVPDFGLGLALGEGQWYQGYDEQFWGM